MFDIAPFAHGLALGLGMFVCPGPKDVTILREAATPHARSAALVGIAVVSDALLIWLGIAGAAATFERFPGLRTAALWLGVGLMLLHAARAAARALGAGAAASLTPAAGGTGLPAVALVSLANPAAWLDTVIVIGGIGAALPLAQQWPFAGGAVLASMVWFVMLVGAARLAGRWLASARTWRRLDAAVAVTMAGMAAATAIGVAG
jgi:L-lysine exporter family protein LysE/ArgO